MNSKSILLMMIFFSVNNLNSQSMSKCQIVKGTQQISSLYYSAENMRSDTFDVLHYDIHLEMIYSSTEIKGYTDVKLVPKINGQTSVSLDLLKMQIDSVFAGTNLASYVYNDTLLSVSLGGTKNIGDTFNVIVYYHGVPQMDASGWGGFYFNGNYAFNLGVGFAAKPHNFGRVWFPCFDNFVEKSTYDFYITSDSSKFAYCNGALVSDTIISGKRTRHWKMSNELPSYLASVAVADYREVKQVISTPLHTISAVIAARASDTNGVKSAFIHLPNAVNIFEDKYGMYRWNRVGYCLVPFSSGAMEHATNIAYPQLAIGTTVYESQLMAHELSHHWWGDLVTCETQEDMWLNEGMATYSEMIFLENMYNYSQYESQLLSMLSEMIQFGNFKEQQYWAVSGVSAQYTYSDHVYKKGAIVAHNLRTYLGDSLFFGGLKYVLNQKQFKNMNSSEFQTLLENFTGKSLNKFFQNWVFGGGYPVFVIDSAKYQNVGGSYLATVYVKQKRHGAVNYFDSVPVDISFFDSNWVPYNFKVILSGSVSVITATLNFLPQFEILNYNKKLAYATMGDAKVIKNTGNITFANSKVSINVTNAGNDSSFIYIEHHFAGADGQKNLTGKKYKISNQHFWRVSGKLSNGFAAKLRLYYNGNIIYSGYGCMDTCLASINADSITVLYRPNAASDWREMSFTKYPSGSKSGMLFVDSLLLGEYTFANKAGTFTGIEKIDFNKMREIKIYPNPTQNTIEFVLPEENYQNYLCSIYSTDMKKIKTLQMTKNEKLDVSNLPVGYYFLVIKSKENNYYAKFVKN